MVSSHKFKSNFLQWCAAMPIVVDFETINPLN
jgi:hypothetical protein